MKKIVFISNIICEPYLRICLSNKFSTTGSDVYLTCISYNEIDKMQSEVEKAEIIIVFLNFETLYPNVINDIGSKNIFEEDIVRDADMKMHELYSKIKMNSSAKIIWFGFEDYYINYNNVFGAIPLLSNIIDNINQTVCEMLVDDVNIDLKRLIAEIGVSNAYDNKGKYRWNAPYSEEMLIRISDEIFKQYQTIGIFQIDKNDIDEETYEHLIKANTIAIIFPFIRSQVSLLTTQPGMMPVIIPPININAFVSEQN